MHRQPGRWAAAAAWLLAWAGAAAAAPLPPPLQPWATWVLEGETARQCTLRADRAGETGQDFACVASTGLVLTEQPHAVRFDTRVRADAPTTVALPGGAQHWPQDVTVDGQPAVLQRGPQGDAELALAAGEHRLSGRWGPRPTRLQTPALFGVARWAAAPGWLRYEEGHLWLAPAGEARAAAAAVPPDATEVRVRRLWQTGQVPRLTTRVRVDVSGSARALALGPVLPPGFVPLSWSGGGGAVLGQDGRLHLQAVAGTVEVEIQARCASCVADRQGVLPATAGARPAAPAPWPRREIWSFANDSGFGQAAVQGAGVDPAQADVPVDWRAWPAYRVEAGQPLVVRQTSRGRRAGEGEQLNVDRDAWLDPQGWVLRDRLTGRLPVGGRLAMRPPYALGRVEVAGQPWPLSVDEHGAVGLAWVNDRVDLVAQARRPHGRAPAAGWDAPIDALTVRAHLPPGHVLWAAPGAAPGNGAWVDGLSLFTFFAVAVFALVLRPLIGLPLAVAAGALALGCYATPGARGLCGWLAAAAVCHLVARVLPPSRLARTIAVARPVLLTVFALAWAVFAMDQVRWAIYPQLQPPGLAQEEPWDSLGDEASASAPRETAAAPPMPTPAPVAPDAAVARAAPLEAAGPDPTVDPLVGIGLASAGEAWPRWADRQGTTHTLVYAGPLRASDPARVWVVPPWATRPLRVLGVLGLAILGAAVGWRSWPPAHPRWPRPAAPRWARRWAASVALALAAWPVLAQPVPPPPDVPSAQMLADLKQRLTQPPACAPRCAALLVADLAVDGDRAVLTYRVSVAHPTQWSVPRVEGAVVESVEVDASPAWWSAPGVLALPRGVVRVQARYRVPDGRVNVAFDPAPAHATERLGAGWSGEGVVDGRLPTGAWAVERGAGAAQAVPSSSPAAAAVPAFVQVQRTLVLGAEVTLETRVVRVDAGEGGATVELPKVSGEAPQDDRVSDAQDRWRVSLAAGERERTWSSRVTLGPGGAVALRALPSTQGEERWRLRPGPGWSVGWSGVPEAQPQVTAQGLIRQALPLGGENLALTALRLPAAGGPPQRLDAVEIATQTGPREARHRLVLDVVATQAGERTVRLPAGAELIDVHRSGTLLSVAARGGAVTVPVERGPQRLEIGFRTPRSGAVVRAPTVDVGGPAANVLWRLTPEEGRWVWWASPGPGWGMAVLYWSQLAVLLALAWVLSRWPGRWLTWSAAFALAVGLSTFAAWAFVLLMAWQGWVRSRAAGHVPQRRWAFNLSQLALAGFSAVVLLAVVVALAHGLWGAQPDMRLRAPPGLGLFEWWLDVAPAGPLKGPAVWTAPMWLYRAVLFVWALWFARWLISALREAFAAWVSGGHWRGRPPPAENPAP